jgi:dolichyl-phosphate beta-glucosyltransferase
MSPLLSIIIPAYNEAHRLPESIRELVQFSQSLNFDHEVLVVVEKSTDNTLELARQGFGANPHFRILNNRVHRGKGYASRSGMLQANGQYRFFMDADLSTPLQEVHAFLAYFQSHPEVDLLIGSRQHPESQILKSQSWLRETMGQTFNRFMRSIVPLPFADTQCGFKAFRANAAEAIFSRATVDGFAFDVEVLLLAKKLGFKTIDLPVRWTNSPDSKVHIVRDSLRMLWDTVKIRLATRVS